MKVGSLFSGIGGFDLGLERAGMEIAWQCESSPFRREILAKHWPDLTCYSNVIGLSPPYVDILCGGFPCQDISVAGSNEGIHGSKSSIWSEFARIIDEVRPKYVIVENVCALRYQGRGMDTVLRDLAACGYDAEWDCLPAVAFGSPHQRDRIWIVAYSGCEQIRVGSGREQDKAGQGEEISTIFGKGWRTAHARVFGLDNWLKTDREKFLSAWTPPSELRGVDDGVSRELDARERLSALGDSLVPQIAQYIGERIMEYESPRA